MAVSFHSVQPTSAPTLACDECGCVVDGSERGRSAHERWHAGRDEIVVDLRTGGYRQVWKRHRGTLTSARDARADLLVKAKKGEVGATNATVAELIDAWLADLERVDRAPKTLHEYRADADRYWIPAIGK